MGNRVMRSCHILALPYIGGGNDEFVLNIYSFSHAFANIIRAMCRLISTAQRSSKIMNSRNREKGKTTVVWRFYIHNAMSEHSYIGEVVY